MKKRNENVRGAEKSRRLGMYEKEKRQKRKKRGDLEEVWGGGGGGSWLERGTNINSTPSRCSTPLIFFYFYSVKLSSA